mmetsp:Transcript_11902/g.24155  ORF Transcript_11902/g.24155 Transcript_11902/m.24155 type:complete len:239 (-) Transcript_11902:124-840(-)|eukprot:CAMPEP_0119064068 /NCGR_PEP_ID=MMETSP1178-20130426/7257_1 /TAXON_ID=33656 /ORGANISM="unid sp, Strain CCMP2000" /LENGTH=238 /DNA_ID=CAMNT_0007045477 /DNA_START=30 /DNA_END=746 /DNA_ORIENTATION=+
MRTAGSMVAGDYPRPRDPAGADVLLHTQQRGADLGTGPGSHAAYTAWKRNGVPTAQHPSSQQMFGAPTVRGQPDGLLFPPRAQPQPLPSRAVSQGRNILTWEGEAEVAPRTTWDPLRREEISHQEEAQSGDSVSQRFNAHRFGGQPPQQKPNLVSIEKENPSQTWGQLMASARSKRPTAPSAALCMIDGLGSDERAPSSAPRLPADNMNYLGMRIPGQSDNNYRRSYRFSSQFSDPFL